MSLVSRLAMIGVLIGGYKIYQDRVNQKSWKQYEDSLFNSESEGEKVRNRLQGSDVYPEEDMLSKPSIYRDWPMVQKGYQSLRMMNDNDNFNAEGFGSEWHHFAPCETAGCDGDIEYRDVYACPSCGQDDVEILIGDTCPDCGETADETSKYAIFYCSDCEEDYTDMYNAEVRTLSGKPLQLRKLTKDRDLKPEDAIERLEISAEGEYRKCTICEEPAHPLYRGKGSLEGARRICYSCNKQAMKDRPSFNNSMTFDADEFNAHVYRGKPMTELSYSGRAMATKKMMDAADLEATMLQLENAIRIGLISEDELMKELQNKFGSK